MGETFSDDEYADSIQAYRTDCIGGLRVATVEVQFLRDLGDDALNHVVARLLGRLNHDGAAVVLLTASSIHRTSITTQSFGFRMIHQLALRRVTLGQFNFHTFCYEIYFSYHRPWPFGSIHHSAVLARPRQSTIGQARGARPPLRGYRTPAVSLEEVCPHITELHRLLELADCPNQNAKKRKRRLERLEELRHELGLLNDE